MDLLGQFSTLREQRLKQGLTHIEEERLSSVPGLYTSKVVSPLGSTITIQIPLGLDSIAFELFLSPHYPVTPPRLTCTSHFVRPSLADGRDLLLDVLQTPWTVRSSLAEVAGLIPEFLTRVKTSAPTDLHKFGTFHIGECLDFSTWQRQEHMGVFHCLEIDPHNPKYVRDRYIVVTELCILQLDPSKFVQGTGYLTSHSSFTALAGCSSVYHEEDRLSFQWRPCGSAPAAVQLLKLKQVEACLKLLMTNMGLLGIQVTKHQIRPRPTLQEEEVSSTAVMKVKINKVMNEIKKKEAQLDKQVKLETINVLMKLIQEAIEYFSAVGDSRADEYLMKIHNVLMRDDVQNVLNAIDELQVHTASAEPQTVSKPEQDQPPPPSD